MKYKCLAIAGCSQETGKAPGAAYGLSDKPFSQCTESHRLDCRLDLSFLPCFLNFGLVFETKIQGRQSGRCVAQAVKLGDTGGQNKLVGNVVHAPR